MSNSSLVNYKKISPNRTISRNHEIDTISIHCMAGDLSIEDCGDLFADPARKASSNYGIGSDGRIGLYVEETDRSYCSSNSANDHRAVTIEVANDGGADTGWHISDAAYRSLINLCADICRRNGIKELKWKADKSLIGQVDKQNMTVHRWFAAKACPGDYLYNLHGTIASEVNSLLKGTSVNGLLYRVQVGAYSSKTNADSMLKKVSNAGYDTYMTMVNGLYKVQVGAYYVESNAYRICSELKKKGFDAFVTTRCGDAVPTSSASNTIKVGSIVRLKTGAKTYDGVNLASFVYNRNHEVKSISGDKVVITYNGTVVAAVKLSDLALVQ